MHHAARRLLLAAALLAVPLGACGDDDDAAPETTTSEAPTTTDETSTSATTTDPPACRPVSVPDDAVEVTDVEGDVDGDGTADDLRTYLIGADWHLQVELAADGGGADLVIPSFGGLVGIIGGADIDGDGTDEVWLRTGSGASATIVGLARLVDCDLARVTFAGDQLAELPVGGSVGTTSGLECSGSRITAYTASLREGTTYDVTGTEYTLDGSVLTESGTSTTTVDALDDAEFVPVSSFSCGDLVL